MGWGIRAKMEGYREVLIKTGMCLNPSHLRDRLMYTHETYTFKSRHTNLEDMCPIYT